ncbi:MAG: cohesin domain-containing protein [Bryobacteraceae bacterium]|nr:cohesin domain-containing protein [Bryobacteraceae bacterium]
MNRLVAKLVAPAALLAVLMALALPLPAHTKKGDKLAAEGLRFEMQREYDKALEKYELALATDTSDFNYQLMIRRVRFQAGQLHVDNGLKLRTDGKLDEALAEFNKAYTIDPSSTSAEQEIRRTLRMIEREKLRKANGGKDPETAEERGMTPSQTVKKESEQREADMVAPPELKTTPSQPLDLKISNQPVKTLYETVGKMAGINVLFDSDLPPDTSKRQSLDLKDTQLEDALDYIALLTHTYWKPVSANTIFVTQESATKRRDYEDHVTRVFYLQNITSAPELQEVMTAVRTVTNVRNIFPVSSQNALVIRGTTDQIELAEKIILDIDKPKSEVLVDMIVLEVNGDKTRNLAATVAPGGLNMTAASTPGGGTTTPLSKISHLGLGDWTTTMPSALLQATLTDTRAKILTTPQLRGIEGQKASLKIGDRYPYASGSFSSPTATTSGVAYAQTQFQFADIGVNVDITPRIHGSDEVTLQVDFEISNISSTIDVGGVSQPVIGQRKVNHIIRLKEGEAALIGGLMQVTQTSNRSGWPFLMDIPLLGKLFTSTTNENKTEDLLVVLVPHIMRSPDVSAANMRAVATGSDQVWKVNYRRHTPPAAQPAPGVTPLSKPEGAAQPVVQPQAAIVTAPAAAPHAAPPSNAVAPQPPPAPQPAQPAMTDISPALQAPASQPKPEASQAKPEAPAQVPAVVMLPSASEVQTGSTVTVQINVSNVKDLMAAPMRVKYDATMLKLVEVKAGGFLGDLGKQVIFSEVRARQGGESRIQLQRLAGSGGVDGSGTLLTLKFEAKGPGVASISVADFSLRDSKLQSLPVAPPQTSVTVK